MQDIDEFEGNGQTGNGQTDDAQTGNGQTDDAQTVGGTQIDDGMQIDDGIATVVVRPDASFLEQVRAVRASGGDVMTVTPDSSTNDPSFELGQDVTPSNERLDASSQGRLGRAVSGESSSAYAAERDKRRVSTNPNLGPSRFSQVGQSNSGLGGTLTIGVSSFKSDATSSSISFGLPNEVNLDLGSAWLFTDTIDMTLFSASVKVEGGLVLNDGGAKMYMCSEANAHVYGAYIGGGFSISKGPPVKDGCSTIDSPVFTMPGGEVTSDGESYDFLEVEPFAVAVQTGQHSLGLSLGAGVGLRIGSGKGGTRCCTTAPLW